MNKRKLKVSKRCFMSVVFLTACLFITVVNASAQDRFPRPDFKSSYTSPVMTQPPASPGWIEYIDYAVLVLTLLVSAFLIIKKRQRNAVLICTVFSLFYFGFWRKGCVCSVGSLQNIVLAVFTPGYAIPLFVVLFFITPLIFALFFGRVFCASVCPLGALQELVALKPIQLPMSINKGFGFFRYIYFGFALLFAATGAEFIICKYDPFVGFFRQGATLQMFIFGVIILITGIFIARPYCRFLCPYSVLLELCSSLSKFHITITPGKCIQCRLCENSCPTGAIKKPIQAEQGEKSSIVINRLSLISLLFVILPVVLGLSLSLLSPLFSTLHPAVRTANFVNTEAAGEKIVLSIEGETFRTSGKTFEQLYSEAASVQMSFKIGSWITGIFLGLMMAFKLFQLSVIRKQTDYEPDRASCVSCSRCIDYCPVEHKSRKDKKKE